MEVIRSSYRRNSFSKIFENTVFSFPPRMAVELGILDGYSAFSIGRGLRKAHEIKGSIGHLHAYDLWDDYPYKHGNMEMVQVALGAAKVEDYVTLHKADAFLVHREYEDDSVDFLHVDISNTGGVIKHMVEHWTPKIRHCGLFLFEGGSEERDNVEWMKKYEGAPIRPVLGSNPIIKENYIYGTYGLFPSLTVMKKVTL